MSDYTFGEAKLVLADGTELSQWSEYSIDSDFLTPCDGWSFTWADIKFWSEVKDNLKPDKKVEIYIDDALQCTGWIDVVTVKSDPSGGTQVNIQGRDIMRPLVKANIHPDMRVKDTTIAQLIEKVLKYYYVTVPTVYYDNNANVKVLSGGLDTGVKKSKKENAQKVLEYCQAHPNEGAFEFLARNLKRHGLWLWSTADGGMVVGGPTYSGDPAAVIERKVGQTQIVAPSAEYKQDRTNCVSDVFVRGKGTTKEFSKATVQGQAQDPRATSTDFYEPLFTVRDQAETADQATAYAYQVLSALRKNEQEYHVTCIGHRNPSTNYFYAIDTLVKVFDEICGVDDVGWCCGRTFKKSLTGGTTTELRILPVGTVLFDASDAP